MQLTMVGREVWRGARKAQELNGAGAGDTTVQERLQKLKQVEAFRKHKVDWPEIQQPVQELPGEQNAQTDENGGEYAESSIVGALAL